MNNRCSTKRSNDGFTETEDRQLTTGLNVRRDCISGLGNLFLIALGLAEAGKPPHHVRGPAPSPWAKTESSILDTSHSRAVQCCLGFDYFKTCHSK